MFSSICFYIFSNATKLKYSLYIEQFILSRNEIWDNSVGQNEKEATETLARWRGGGI